MVSYVGKTLSDFTKRDKRGGEMNITEGEKAELKTLETKAKYRYIEYSDWDSALQMLDEDERNRVLELVYKEVMSYDNDSCEEPMYES